jgi:hypothetical protein
MTIMGVLDRKLFSLLVLIADVVMFVTGAVEFRFLNVLRFFADRAAKKWPLRGSLKYAGVLLAYPP